MHTGRLASLSAASLIALAGACTDKETPRSVLPPADPAALSVARAADAGILRSPGCGKAPPVAAGVLVSTTGGRTFRVHTPRGYDASRAYPVLFAFHGIDSNGGELAARFKIEEHVMGEAIVVYPDARKASYGGTAWELGGDRDVTAFDDMRSAVAQGFCVDVARVYAMGFSYGGKFINSLACRRPGVLRAVSSSESSWGNANESTCKPVPMLVTHRTTDPDELLEWGRGAADTWARIDGCDGPKATDVTDAAHGCVDYRGCKAKVTFCEDRYVNDAWPRGANHTIREEYIDLIWRWLRQQ